MQRIEYARTSIDRRFVFASPDRLIDVVLIRGSHPLCQGQVCSSHRGSKILSRHLPSQVHIRQVVLWRADPSCGALGIRPSPSENPARRNRRLIKILAVASKVKSSVPRLGRLFIVLNIVPRIAPSRLRGPMTRLASPLLSRIGTNVPAEWAICAPRLLPRPAQTAHQKWETCPIYSDSGSVENRGVQRPRTL